jgi:hypothetical protein
LGLDKGPTTLLEAYNAATRFKVVSVNNIPVPAAVFTAQHSTPTPAHDGGRVDDGRGGRGRGRLGGRGVGRGGLIKTNDTAEGEKKAEGCILCGEQGHFFRKCPHLESCQEMAKQTKGSVFTFPIFRSACDNLCLYLKNYGIDHEKFVLLDNEASTNIFRNKSLLFNVQISPTHVMIGGINGDKNASIVARHFGNFKCIPGVTVHWSQHAAANALSWSELRDLGIYNLGYDESQDYFYLIDDTDKKHIFKRYGRLYGKIYDDNKVDEEIYSYTVESNTKLYTKRQIHDADKARKFQHDMGVRAD